MYHCKTCGWKFSGKYCPRCGSLNFDESSCVTLSSYGGCETDIETDEDRASYARSTLWDALHETIPDKIKCLSLASALLLYVPGDYLASFACVAYSFDEKAMNDFLWKSLSKDAGMYAEVVLDFVCSHMSANLYYAVRSFIDRTRMKDPTKYETIINGCFPDSTPDAEKFESEIREIAERVVKDVVEREMNEVVKLIDEEKKEKTEKANREINEATERIVKEVAEREVSEISERKERESREAEERERKEKEERRKAEDERKRREQQEAADRAEKEKREAEATKRKREEESVLSADGYSKGFEFEKRGSGYVLTWIGDCEDTNILIPPVYNGAPVTGVGDKAFVGCNDIKSVTVPSGVTSVGNEAFAGCEGLESVKLPDTLETIGESAFMQCTTLKTVDMPAVTTIGKSAFSGCGHLSKLTLPEGLKIIKDEAFSHCSGRLNDEVMVIPSGVTKIGEKAFYGTYLSKIYIPVTVTSIGEDAFSYGTTLYYLGTESQWYTHRVVYFYSASRPRDLGHFWHYDEKGNAVEW